MNTYIVKHKNGQRIFKDFVEASLFASLVNGIIITIKN